MKLKILMFGIIGLILCSVASAVPYTILPNDGSKYDMYVNTPESGQYIITATEGYSPNGSAVFEEFDDFEYGGFGQFNTPIAERGVQCETPTPDGSGQVIHPSVLYFKDGWNGYKYWMGITGYFKENNVYENPILLASHDGITWVVPDKITNPIEPYPGGDNFCSDINICYDDKNDQLYITYRMYWADTQTIDVCMRTYDGNTVSDKTILLSCVGSGNLERSASVLIDDGVYYYIANVNDEISNTGFVYRTSTDGITYSDPQKLPVSYLTNKKITPWHSEVKYVPELKKYVMLIHGNSSLYIGESDSILGEYVVHGSPILKDVTTDIPDKIIYKSSFIYENSGKMRMWYSGIDGTSNCYIFYTEFNYQLISQFLDNTNFRVVVGNPNIVISDGMLTVNGLYDGIGSANNLYSTFQCRMKFFDTDGNIGLSNPLSPPTSMYYKNMNIIRKSSNRGYFNSIEGDGSNFTLVESTYPKDSEFHTLVHYRNGTSVVDEISWSNTATLYQNIPKGFFVFGNTSVDYYFQTNKKIAPAEYIKLNSTSYLINSNSDVVTVSDIANSKTESYYITYIDAFTSSITEGHAPFTTKFSGNYVGATKWYWDFENDGIIDSTKQNPVHTYGQSGAYTVNLTVTTGDGNISIVKPNYITITPPAFSNDPIAWFNWVFRYISSIFVGSQVVS